MRRKENKDYNERGRKKTNYVTKLPTALPMNKDQKGQGHIPAFFNLLLIKMLNMYNACVNFDHFELLLLLNFLDCVRDIENEVINETLMNCETFRCDRMTVTR